MSPTPDASGPHSDRVRRATSNEAFGKLARLGFAVKGLVYALVGVLAIRAALGAGGGTSGSRGAITSLAGEPFGQVLLWVVAVGTAGYALWRFASAVGDPDGVGADAKGIARRLGYVGSGVTYAGLAFFTVRLLLGDGGGEGDEERARSMTATLMEQPFGPWLVGAAGLVMLGVAFFQFKQAWTADFFALFKRGQMSAAEQTWTRRFGRFGIASRAVVFALIGFFLLRAALEANPGEARGIGGALDALAAQPYGPYLLGAVAFGLVAYGGYCFVVARYRRIGR